ncbi:MAG: UDP-2,3-diacylglucosamine diphosphatase [Saprospiraceae bacterium]|nr:UDP-2,3-diacylglucosamine diphosphatase [Saprospiraceae bacterium]
MAGKTYFASDFHLGVDARLSSTDREAQIVRWLDQIALDAEAIYLVGDVFDYWFEYKSVVPKGYIRILGKLAELRARDIPIYYFTGNHDMWMFRYLDTELGIPIYRTPIVREIGGKTFLIGHGDGLGPGDYGYKFIKRVFNNRVCQWLYGHLIHPDLAWRIARFWSKKSRGSGSSEQVFLGEDREWLIQYANETLDHQEIDFFIFGHRHLPIDFMLKNGKSRYINLGEWLNHNSYAVFNGRETQIQFFENDRGHIYPD